MLLALAAAMLVQAPPAPHRVLIRDVTIVSPERKTRCGRATSSWRTTGSPRWATARRPLPAGIRSSPAGTGAHPRPDRRAHPSRDGRGAAAPGPAGASAARGRLRRAIAAELSLLGIHHGDRSDRVRSSLPRPVQGGAPPPGQLRLRRRARAGERLPDGDAPGGGALGHLPQLPLGSASAGFDSRPVSPRRSHAGRPPWPAWRPTAGSASRPSRSADSVP